MRIVLILCLLLLCGCQKKQGKPQESHAPKIESDTTLTKTKLISGKQHIDDWAELLALESELEQVVTTRKIRSPKDLELLKKLLDDLKNNYDPKFKIMAIEARIKVLETEILMLEQDLKDNNLKAVDVKLERIRKAYNVFVNQIAAFIAKEKDYEKYR